MTRLQNQAIGPEMLVLCQSRDPPSEAGSTRFSNFMRASTIGASISNVRAELSSWVIVRGLAPDWPLILIIPLVPAAKGRRFTHSIAGSNLDQLWALSQVRHTASGATAVLASPSILHISAPPKPQPSFRYTRPLISRRQGRIEHAEIPDQGQVQ